MLLNGTGRCSTEVKGESFAFDEIRELAERLDAEPGKAFTVELDLRESLGEITVEHEFTEFGNLEISDTLKAVWAGVINDAAYLEVNARIWTCPDWDEDFYASVRVDLPPIEDAIQQIEDGRAERIARSYGTADPNLEQVQRSYDELLAEASDPETARRAHERHGQPLAQDANPYRAAPTQNPAPTVTPAVDSPAIDWEDLLTPDGTPRANLFQRAYARAIAGKATGDAMAPRIDYATVGQCTRIVAAYGGDVKEVDKRNGFVLKALWLIVLFLLGIVALIGVFTPPGGWVFTALVAWPFVHHYVTRRKLQPPFGPQR